MSPWSEKMAIVPLDFIVRRIGFLSVVLGSYIAVGLDFLVMLLSGAITDRRDDCLNERNTVRKKMNRRSIEGKIAK